jgi:hypothetical protein
MMMTVTTHARLLYGPLDGAEIDIPDGVDAARTLSFAWVDGIVDYDYVGTSDFVAIYTARTGRSVAA